MTKLPSKYKHQKKFWILSSVSLMLVFAYLGLVGKTVYNVVQRQRAETQITDLGAKVSELEFSYLHTKSSINGELARQMGFVESSKTLIAKKKANVSLSMNNEI